ncbi:hypothetical protein [Nocardia terpenica]|uniref:Uncharacterized protein n=1 Tax=Nocardia terpenica TaxID=455432 RepID=A0A6G9Z115_9NOCA|nr:hypothetical protein [Nocardia terpenica]QIS19275.1 hypothetical protein F6W96_14255 [Nocardia terpenica]
MKSSGVLLVSALLCFCGYGLIRLAGKAGGQYGPGFVWQVAHLVGLVALVLFVPVALVASVLLAADSLDLVPVAGLGILGALLPITRIDSPPANEVAAQ